MSITRFFCIDKLIEFGFFSIIIYPIVSQIKCDHFDRFFIKLCTNNIIDNPVIAFDTFFMTGTFEYSPIILCLILFILIISFFFSSFLKLRMTKITTKNHKSILQHCKVIVIFTAEIFIFNLPDMQNGNLKVGFFCLISIIRCIGFFFFVIASVLIYEIYPVKICNLHKDCLLYTSPSPRD